MPIDVIEKPKVIPKARKAIQHSQIIRKIKYQRKLNSILRMLDQGYSISEAAQELGITHHNVWKWAQAVKKSLKNEQSELNDVLRINSNRKLTYVYRQFLEEFEQSKKDSKGARKPGNPEYLYGARELIQDIVKLHGLNIEQQPNQTNVAFNWASLMQPLANAVQPTMELQPSAVIANDPIEDQIKQLESSADVKEESISESAHITVSDKPIKKRVILKASNGKNGHANMNGSGSGKYVHPDE
jgi:transposase-like protein